MITGIVNADLEAIVSLMIVGAHSSQQSIDVIIDTGFNGHLTLPPSLIGTLQLAWLGRDEGVLADGSVDLFDVYRATILWNGQPRAIDVEAVNTQPLGGMSLLERHTIRMDVQSGGTVSIVPLP